MSIYKNEQRDGRTLWGWLCGLFGEKCRSVIHPQLMSGDSIRCVLRRGHSGKHRGFGYKWGYGDNWLEGN